MAERTPVAAVRAILIAAGIPEAAAAPAAAGFAVAAPAGVTGRLSRAAVTWPAERRLPSPGPNLSRCRQALQRAGCLCAPGIGPDGGYLAVIIPDAAMQEAAR